MKRILAVLVVLLLCTTLICPALAADNSFVPSISEKDHPKLVPVRDTDGSIMHDEHGHVVVGLVLDADGKTIGVVTEEDCLVVTTVPEAEARTTAIPEEARLLLLRVYKEIMEGSMVVPFEKANTVIRELLDATFLCEEHPRMLEPEGVVLQLTFDLGVDADVDVDVLTYKEEQWGYIVSSENNGDGTVTCVFEHLCPIAFGVSATTQAEATPDTGDHTASDLMLWTAVLAASACAVVVLSVVYFRKRRAGK